jgi:hypothetical protein
MVVKETIGGAVSLKSGHEGLLSWLTIPYFEVIEFVFAPCFAQAAPCTFTFTFRLLEK